ncbi:hypothetical protein LOZ39_005801 [Ophidiomyces ophidiicola]|nr:hypothetical protein LOZ64_006122 [Ophidiomyces ophidiicola]KAI1907039.1 hypothetical protein LOZ61_006359 [Ophidiomyces ophidiicola]KAI1926258.1 hypothetical protein LOZ60_003734 [Ophidiomyces ophidiicola]KAI1956921.1 hypothetical protein LOZ59_004091 [Ophidiomyces ophidiicola]KAI2006316.1 hypothetical protein LOZ49_005073 [Ophidiomyces ophidiicola]
MISLYPLLVVFCGSLASGFSLFKRDGLKVLSPTRGERFSTGIDIEIRWEVSDAKQVKLELRKGLPDSLTTVHSISSATSNNGSYQWRSRDDSFLRAPSTAKLPTAPPTGCDYLIAVRDTERLANSDYFAIINPRDGDLAKDAECPGAAPSSQSQGNPSATGGNQNRGAGIPGCPKGMRF